jgi:DtxR family transcriptional regulator, Mn-dependent transcriptional regulator
MRDVPEGFHPPVEEYLETIHALEEEGVTVIQARLVERLGHTPQAVSEMVQRLEADGYVSRAGRGLELTEKGHQRAESVVRRHRLAERFLVDILGLPWHKAHEEAGQWEHVISDDVEERFLELLGHPTTCPHGNPIPGAVQSSEVQFAMTEINEGSHVRLARITEVVENDYDALVYLSDHGWVPGRGALVSAKAPDGTLTLSLDATDDAESGTVALGPAICRQLFVTALV